MTSAEFAAKYRVLKTITERGARTQIAQESALGRMVMLHHLDVGTEIDRRRLVEKLSALSEAASAKVFDVVTVEATQVIVTHYLATFTDLPSWIDDNTVSGDAPTLVMEAMPRPEPSAGGFTSIFGAPKPPESKAAPSPAVPASQPPVSPSPPPVAPADQGVGFTSVFGKLAPPPSTPVQVPSFSSAPPATPLPPTSPRFERSDSVMPPAAPYAPPPSAPSAPAPAAGDFTQLFQRLDPQATTPPASSNRVPPAAVNAPPSPSPVPGGGAPPPPSWQAPAPVPPAPVVQPPPFRPPAGPPPVMQSIGGQAAGPSEFTRVLGKVAPPGSNRPPLPPVPNLPTPPVQKPVAPAPAATPNAEPSSPPARSYLPLIIALNVILIGAIVLVVFLVLKK